MNSTTNRRAFSNALWAYNIAFGIILIVTCRVQSVSSFSVSPLPLDVISLQPDGSANDVLCQILHGKNNSNVKQLIRLSGFVAKRRAIGKSLVFLDIVPLELPKLETHNSKKGLAAADFASMKPVQVIMRRDFWNKVNKADEDVSFDVYQKIIQPGVHVDLMGEAGPSRIPQEAILFCHNASYKLPNDNPQHLRNVLGFLNKGSLNFDEIGAALSCLDREELSQMLSIVGREASTAVDILSRFPRNFLLDPSNLMGTTNSAKVALLPPIPNEYNIPPSFSFSMSVDIDSQISTIEHVLKNLQISNQTESSMQHFTFSGWVQNRRRFQNSTSVVEIVEKFSSSALVRQRNAENENTAQGSHFSKAWKETIHAVIQPAAIGGVDIAELYGNIFAPGSEVLIQGCVSKEVGSNLTICWITNCRLLHSSSKLHVVRHILDLLHENKIPIDEAADALSLEGGYAQGENIARGSTSSTDRRWMATEISQSLQGEHSRAGKISPAMMQSLDVYSSLVENFPIESIRTELRPDVQSDCGRTSLTLQCNTNSLSTSRWQRAKKPQLFWMLHQIADVIGSHPDFRLRPLKIVDIGGGKGLLSNLMAENFGDAVEVQVVDISKSATNNGMMRARRRGIENVRYNAQDATTLDLAGVDIVVALHACGTLSDVALGHAVSQGAGFVICPCCFRSNPHLRIPLGKNLVAIEEWLQVEQEFYEPLKRLAEVQGDMNLASRAMHTICALRASAVDRLWKDNRWSSLISTSIKSFPIGYSTRNLCLVGKFVSDRS
ncbi:hypothetical protein HJC23_003508 [Cyclotella cryptica]|uniref:Methyltransferase domain-containing protein n=1 Tax=Cyclotella cryptica TaxID=29204 RepID=A0ABD3PC67_9STRA